jgi:hypothetical protein
MSSTQRNPSQVPPSGTYITTGDLSGAVFSVNETTRVATAIASGNGVPTAAGSILYDMGKTFYLPGTGAANTQVLRKVQVAPFESNVTFVSFYIKIGGTGTGSPVARL